MALTLVHECPHCGVERIGFTYWGGGAGEADNGLLSFFFTCNGCGHPVCVTGRGHPALLEPGRLHGDMLNAPISGTRFYPKPRPLSIPAYCTPAVSEAFRQAEDNARRKNWEAAVSMDRRALDVATKEIDPNLASLGLFHRIERLTSMHLLTPSLKDWSHSLRTVGNDALHAIDGVTEAEAVQTHELTRFILTYLFTLPKQVELAKAAP